MIFVLIKGVIRFQRLYAKLYYQFCYINLAVNIVLLILFTTALGLVGPGGWTNESEHGHGR